MHKELMEEFEKMDDTMTHEKFTIEKHGGGLFTLFKDGKILSVLDGQPVVDTLNEQNTIIQTLK